MNNVFYVFGDYGYTSECELRQFDNQEDAIRFVQNYTRFGDFGGYKEIAVAKFHDEEYVDVFSVTDEMCE